MAYKNQKSASLTNAEKCSAGLISIQADGKLDLGNGNTHPVLDAKTEAVRQ